MPANKKEQDTYDVDLLEPFKVGGKLRKKITVRKPKPVDLIGTSLSDLVENDAEALLTVLQKVGSYADKEPLGDEIMLDLGVADLMSLGGVLSVFLRGMAFPEKPLATSTSSS